MGKWSGRHRRTALIPEEPLAAVPPGGHWGKQTVATHPNAQRRSVHSNMRAQEISRVQRAGMHSGRGTL